MQLVPSIKEFFEKRKSQPSTDTINSIQAINPEPKVVRKITPAQHFAAHFKIGLQNNVNRCQRLLNQHYEHEQTRSLIQEEKTSKEFLIKEIQAKQALTKAHKKCSESWDIKLLREYQILERSKLLSKLETVHDSRTEKYFLRMIVRSNLYSMSQKNTLDNTFQVTWLYGSPTIQVLPFGRTTREQVKNPRLTKVEYLCDYEDLFATLSIASALECALRKVYEKY